MKKIISVFAVVSGLLCTVFASAQDTSMVKIPASNSNIRLVGRVDDSNPNKVNFTYPGVQVFAKFEGPAIDLILKDYGAGSASTINFYYAILDKGAPLKIKVNNVDTVYRIARNLKDTLHTIQLFKLTESQVGKSEFRGFMIRNTKSLAPLDPSPTKKIQFIGNSITCGYGIDTSIFAPNGVEPNTGFHSRNENNFKTFGAITARNLNADYMCVAYSGRGLYRNNSGFTNGTMPLMYDYTFPDQTAVTWSQSRFVPNIIVIDLGTNDFAAEANNYAAYKVDSTTFVSTYISFISKLRGYFPNAQIVLAVGPMMSDYYPVGTRAWTRIQNYVRSVKTYKNANGDSQVYYVAFSPQNPPYGEDWHPTAATHASMATTLTNFINTLPTVVTQNSDDFISGNNPTQLSIYPNPSNRSFSIKSDKIAPYTIVDLNGNMLETGMTSNPSIGVQLKAGIYHVKVGENVLKIFKTE